MTVTSENKRNRYNCDGGQTVFPYTFRILDEIHIQVILIDSEGNETVLTLTTHYTVSGVGDAGGGNVTTVATYSSGYVLTILRNVPLTQLTDYVENDMFPSDSHEDALDKMTMIIQEFVEGIDRMLILAKSSSHSDLSLPDPIAAQYLRWKADLSGLENVPSGDFGNAPNSYGNTMTGNESFTYSSGNHLRCFLDPGGSDRNFNPSGSFPSGFKVEVFNAGEEIITFDSVVSAQNIGPGQLGTFLYDGSVWH